MVEHPTEQDFLNQSHSCRTACHSIRHLAQKTWSMVPISEPGLRMEFIGSPIIAPEWGKHIPCFPIEKSMLY